MNIVTGHIPLELVGQGLRSLISLLDIREVIAQPLVHWVNYVKLLQYCHLSHPFHLN